MKPLRIHYLQHAAFEGPGCIAQWAETKNHVLTSTKLYCNESFPDLSQIDWLIILGGPMGVNDSEKYPWINTEKKIILNAINTGKTVIGICLGSQFIASVLGAGVYKNKEKEIGWFPINNTASADNFLFHDEKEYNVFHWHGETFDLPDNSILLASSEACINQAFLYGNTVLGLQFHFEVTDDSLAQMLTFGKEDIDGSPFTQQPDYIAAQKQLIVENNERMYSILDYFEAN
ncbi:type 1 glutamine amidotransferase [Flavobacterium sp. DG1-102-2]|uniref:type 1 glutamine amidotransferase n=1 Tax=Flavobacterium sp. DG1-102-2 TaxID=3081663 RepID=UPI002949057D|nr:type 1 glutamine amidotransferase [Flavobacterium sp. DG1-102-2]MDV6170257.1 type 1 glutamine amidotransferase [Flavobacterium sp. DG1-102-2]